MGVQDALVNEYKSPAIWRGELLVDVHEYVNPNKVDEVFCVGDGVVLMSDDEEYLLSFLEALFGHYVGFNRRKHGDWEPYYHRFIRAGTGSGRVYKLDIERHDRDKNEGSPFPEEFRNEPFGPGIIEAFTTEGGAPFSIHRPGNEAYKWWKNEWEFMEDVKKKNTLKMLSDYFDYFDERDEYDYDPYGKDHHTAALEFFEGHDLGVDLW